MTARQKEAGRKAGVKFNIYASGMTEEEKNTDFDSLLGSLDNEISIARVQLKRAFDAKAAWVAAGSKDTHMVTIELASEVGEGAKGPITIQKEIRKLPDFDAIIDRAMARINNLERTRAELDGKINSGSETTVIIKGGLPTE